METAQRLIADLIIARSKDKGVFETEKLKLGIAHKLKLDENAEVHRREIERLSSAHSIAHTAVQKEYRKLFAEKEHMQARCDEYTAQSISLITQRNMYRMGLVVCMAGFLGYFLYVQWK